MNYRKSLIAGLLAPLISLGSGALTSVHAAGYAVFTQGASALGQGNAVTAHSDNPSTIFYNPALINKLDGTQVDFGTTVILASHEFDSNQVGGSSTSNGSNFFPSTFYVTHKFSDSLSAGLGVFSPFGLGTEWGDNWDGRYLATKSTLQSFDINPVVSYRIIPSLAVAAGLDVILVDATLERKLVRSDALGLAPPAFDIGQKFKGDGTGVGFNVGVAYDLTKDISFGASYRSEVKVDVKGDSSTSPTVLLLGADSNGKTSIRLPQQVTAGVSYQVIAPLIVETGIRWEGWSAFKELKLTRPDGSTLANTPRNWHDTFGLNLGGKYRLNDTVALMAGYVYGNGAVPDNTFDPTIPDAATHVFSVGTDLNYKSFKIAISYAYQLYEDRTKSNNVDALVVPTATSKANGTYQSDAHLLALSLGYKF
jgi:long-chain fatty acid transport protein